MPSLILSHVTKSFSSFGGPRRILDDVSFEVPAGKIVCLLGPNGSGKTTLLKAVSTLLSLDGGNVRLGDLDIHQNAAAAKRLIGFASTEDHSFYGRLSVRMNLWFYAQLHGVSRSEWERRFADMSARL